MTGILHLRGVPHSWCAQEIDENDLARIAGMSVGLWRPLLATRAVALVQTDASAALGVARRLAGRTLAMNNLAAELGLRLQCMGRTLQDEHLRGILNVESDARLFRSSLSATCVPYASASLSSECQRSSLVELSQEQSLL